MKPLTKTLRLLIEQIFAKNHGPAFAKIFTNWANIVGSSLADISVPTVLDKFDKVLVVTVYEESRAIEIHFMQDIIIERINLLLSSKKIAQTVTKLYVKRSLKS